MTPNTKHPPAAIGKEDVANMLTISVKTVDRMRKRGEIPGVILFGRAVRFNKAVIEEWFADGCPNPEPAST